MPVRNAATLRAHFPGLDVEEIADRLVAGAVKSSAAVGAGVGAAAMLPVPPAMPAELAMELVGVASVELKLVAELHEIYGNPAPGNGSRRTAAYVAAWTEQRGIDPLRPGTLVAASGNGLRQRLRREIARRTLRNLPNLAPVLAGAAVGAVLNRRETNRLAERVRADLRAVGAAGAVAPGADEAVGAPAAEEAQVAQRTLEQGEMGAPEDASHQAEPARSERQAKRARKGKRARRGGRTPQGHARSDEPMHPGEGQPPAGGRSDGTEPPGDER